MIYLGTYLRSPSRERRILLLSFHKRNDGEFNFQAWQTASLLIGAFSLNLFFLLNADSKKLFLDYGFFPNEQHMGCNTTYILQTKSFTVKEALSVN